MSRRSSAVRLAAVFGAACLLVPAVASAAPSCVVGQNAQCPGADLAGRDLTGVSLIGANLENANLSGAKLDRAVLHRANLTGANLTGATASHADLSFVLMNGVHANHVNFSHADLTGSQLEHASFVDAHVAHANFHAVNLLATDFTRATLNDSDFKGANLFITKFDGGNINNAKFAHAGFHGTSMKHMRQNYRQDGGTQLYPSNLNDDATAKSGLFLHVTTHINAYGDYGNCQGESSSDEGYCVGTGEGGHTHGFDNTRNRHASWEWSDKHRQVTFKGEHGVKLTGVMGPTWNYFRVDHLEGLDGVEPSATLFKEHASVGQPGGAIFVNLETRYWDSGFFKATSNTGYIMRLSGYLPRASS